MLLWIISDELEFRKGCREYGESGAVWLIIAGEDITNDLTWGARDGNATPRMPLRESPIWSSQLAVMS